MSTSFVYRSAPCRMTANPPMTTNSTFRERSTRSASKNSSGGGSSFTSRADVGRGRTPRESRRRSSARRPSVSRSCGVVRRKSALSSRAGMLRAQTATRLPSAGEPLERSGEDAARRRRSPVVAHLLGHVEQGVGVDLGAAWSPAAGSSEVGPRAIQLSSAVTLDAENRRRHASSGRRRRSRGEDRGEFSLAGAARARTGDRSGDDGAAATARSTARCDALSSSHAHEVSVFRRVFAN